MTTSYDANIIHEGAGRLYDQANKIILSYVLISFLIGLSVGIVLGRILSGYMDIILGIIFSLFGLCIGFLIGQNKAFYLKFQAQVALCQVEIENHTANFANTSKQISQSLIDIKNNTLALKDVEKHTFRTATFIEDMANK